MKHVVKSAAWILVMALFVSGCQKAESETEAESRTEAFSEAESMETAAETTAETTAEERTEESSSESTEETTAETEEETFLTVKELPRFDGSTSTAPLAEALIAELCRISRADAAGLVHFNKTTTAYENLLKGAADILIIGEANDDILKEKEERGFEWLKEPFATDAFVFIVNENNPVDSITIEQAKKIYTGEITNWSELGGNDIPIEAFQRNSAAGSQTLMEKWVMQGTPMKEVPTEYVIASMDGLMETVKQYDNSAAAIGYSVYYYAEEMRMAQGLKMLKLEGVEPNPETIRSGAYPIINPKYVVIRADAKENAPERRIFDYVLSEEGQKLVAAEGYVSILPFDRPEEETIYNAGRYYPEMITELPAAPDYGILIPYVGRRDTALWPAVNGCVYGLMTTDGKIVTDPGYCSYQSNGKNLLLTSVQADPDGKKRITLASVDGSFIADRIYCGAQMMMDGRIVLVDREGGVTLVDADGTIRDRIPQEKTGLTDETILMMNIAMMNGDMMWAADHILLYAREVESGSMQVEYTLYNLKEEKIVTGSADFYYGLCAQEKISAFTAPNVDINKYSFLTDGFDRKKPCLLYTTEYSENNVITTIYKQNETVLAELHGPLFAPCFASKYNNIYGLITEEGASYYRYQDDTLIFRMPLEPVPAEPSADGEPLD